jgi:hypothetical protein
MQRRFLFVGRFERRRWPGPRQAVFTSRQKFWNGLAFRKMPGNFGTGWLFGKWAFG